MKTTLRPEPLKAAEPLPDQITPQDLETMKKWWDDLMPARYRGLIDARVKKAPPIVPAEE